MFLNIINAIYDKPRANIILNREQQKLFPLNSETRQGCLLSLLLVSIVLEFLVRAIKQEQKIKGIHIAKEKVKLSLIANDMILHLRHMKNSTKKNLLEIINFFVEIAGYKIIIQK
jgi:hypothetical protein